MDSNTPAREAAMEVPPPEWRRPNSTFIIATQERTGSTWLSDLMSQTELLGRPDEYFSPYRLASTWPGRGKTAADSCHLAAERGMTANGVLSFKLFPAHFRALQRTVRLTDWFGEPFWIWLRRRDLLGQAISFSKALQTESWKSTHPQRQSARYDGRQISSLLTQIVGGDALWAAYFARAAVKPLHLWYEDLERDPHEAVGRVSRYGGIVLPEVSLAPNATLHRQRDEQNEEWRARFHREVGSLDVLEWPPRKRRGFLRTLLGR